MPESVSEARRFVSEMLAGCPARETLVACVSEFAANAIVHTDSGHGGVFIVEVARPRDGVARVSVTDEGGVSAPRAGTLDSMAEGGRGLAMVAACTSRWGFADAYPGRTVWAEASWPVGVPSPGRPPRGPDRSRWFRPPAAPSPWQDPALSLVGRSSPRKHNAIAAEAGVSRRTVYSHYADQENLLSQM